MSRGLICEILKLVSINYQKGFAPTLIVVLLAIVLVGAAYILGKNTSDTETINTSENETVVTPTNTDLLTVNGHSSINPQDGTFQVKYPAKYFGG